MARRKNTILVCICTWAGLILAILYSPIGSPELYTSSNCYVANPNVNFEDGHIVNAQNVNFESGNDYNELNVPDYNSEENSSKLSSGNYNYATASNDNTSSNGTAYSSSETQSYQNMKIGSAGGYMGSTNFISNNSSRGTDAASVVAMSSGGITTLSVMTMSAARTVKIAGTPYAPNEGAQNPGGDPDLKTRIPVPDGWGFLLLLAASYGFIKKKFLLVRLNTL